MSEPKPIIRVKPHGYIGVIDRGDGWQAIWRYGDRYGAMMRGFAEPSKDYAWWQAEENYKREGLRQRQGDSAAS